MASLKSIRKRISSVKSTQQITKAMKMVAAAKLRRAQEAAQEARPYADKLSDMLQTVASRVAADSGTSAPRRAAD
jgi:F-type H+-transporting ATPase subunit gamma